MRTLAQRPDAARWDAPAGSLARGWRPPVRLRAKLRVNAAGDASEQEADRVAEQVTRTPDSQAVRRKCACEGGGACEGCGRKEPLVRRQATAGAGGVEAPGIVSEVLGSHGRPLDAAARDFMEPRFGHDFSRVRVHTDARAAESARAVDALAYTVGEHVVFDQGQYRPGTPEGRRLLAHELAHVAQGGGGSLRRKGKTAADVPQLKFEPAVNTPPCACVVFIHHDERKARRTARLLHTNCRYNLAMVEDPASLKARGIEVPKHGEKDPNSLFPPDVVSECMDDETTCRDFVKDKAGSKTKEEILGFAQRQYFLAIKDCSDDFKLPVVSLHNNALGDTSTYRSKMSKKGVANLKLDVDKRKKETGADVLDTIRVLIKEKFGEAGVAETLDTPKTTNIFRWCMSDDIKRCHAGDPEHPDNVVWVTNPEDFEKLKATDTNVVLETHEPKGTASESAGDLSTMFVTLALRLGDELGKKADIALDVVGQEFLDAAYEVLRLLLLLEPKPEDTAAKAKRRQELNDALKVMGLLLEKLQKLRYVNIETEGKGWGKESQRVANYRAIASVLTALGMPCCDVEGKGDAAVEAGLKGADD
ncbi:MAG TPA: DUF4157 domain-containing protein [Pyrinomonadaceae bacterium]|nr:DUF4157 domain-containing protein [Pyrinomonadaceae bacterium]